MGTWKNVFLQIFFLQTIAGTFPKSANVTKALHKHERHSASSTNVLKNYDLLIETDIFVLI